MPRKVWVPYLWDAFNKEKETDSEQSEILNSRENYLFNYVHSLFYTFLSLDNVTELIIIYSWWWWHVVAETSCFNLAIFLLWNVFLKLSLSGLDQLCSNYNYSYLTSEHGCQQWYFPGVNLKFFGVILPHTDVVVQTKGHLRDLLTYKAMILLPSRSDSYLHLK